MTTRVLYSLSFAKDNHPAMVDGKDGVVELFLELRKNKDKKIRKAAIGGLWNMRVQLIDSKTHVELGKCMLIKEGGERWGVKGREEGEEGPGKEERKIGKNRREGKEENSRSEKGGRRQWDGRGEIRAGGERPTPYPSLIKLLFGL